MTVLLSEHKDSFNSIISLTDQLSNMLLTDVEIVDLQNRVSDYVQEIEQHFISQNKSELTKSAQDELNQLLMEHEKIIDLFSKKKDKLSNKIKNLHAGKKMQNTYP